MNFTFWLVLGELMLVSLIVLVFLAVTSWLKRKRLLTQLGGLLERVNRAEPERQARLKKRLMESVGLEKHEAESLGAEIIRSERNLFKIFAEIQFGAESLELSTFDKSVYSVLDHYWELLLIESAKQRPDSVKPKSPEPEKDFIEQYSVETAGESFADPFESGFDGVVAFPEKTGPDEGIEGPGENGDAAEADLDDVFAETAPVRESPDSVGKTWKKTLAK